MKDKMHIFRRKLDRFVLAVDRHNSLLHMSDENFIKRMWRYEMGYEIDLHSPKTFNEKIQWLKVNERKSEYSMMADKVAVKDYVADMIGKEHIIPTLAIWDDPRAIDFLVLPNQFVLKCNHNSGEGMYICKNKAELDASKVKKSLRKALRKDYYISGREWPYKNIPHKVFAEKYMEDEHNSDLRDYKIHCFDGKPMYLQVIGNRNYLEHTGNQLFYTFEWEHAGWQFGDYPPYPYELERPHNLEQMREIAEKLSKGHKYLRVDLYDINNTVYFGELTFHPSSGLYHYENGYDKETDRMLGGLIHLDL